MKLKQGLYVGALCCALSMVSMPVKAGWLELFFPHIDTSGPDLSETLQAPFADLPPLEEGQEAAGKDDYLPENAVPVEKPHRQVAHISEYVSEIVSQSLLYEGADYRKDLLEVLSHFDAAGKQEYQTFLAENNILKVLQSGKYAVRSFVMDVPLLLNAGPVDGRYRWLFEVPVMVSYMEKGDADYRDGGKSTNQKIVIRLQVGRHLDAQNQTGILVEKWSGTVRKIDKK
jgi:hypothetical protein